MLQDAAPFIGWQNLIFNLRVVPLTLICESWKKNPKRGTVTERVFREKIQSGRGFFPEIALGDGSQKLRDLPTRF